MIAARPPARPAVRCAGPSSRLSETWLAMREATATTVNRVKRMPTLLRALRHSAVPIRVNEGAIGFPGYVTNDQGVRTRSQQAAKVPTPQATASRWAAGCRYRSPQPHGSTLAGRHSACSQWRLQMRWENAEEGRKACCRDQQPARGNG